MTGRRISDLEWLRALGVSDENMAIRIGRTPAVVQHEIMVAVNDDTREQGEVTGTTGGAG